MLLGKIWERHFFKQILKTVILFLCCFYAIYVLIDYPHHRALFQQDGKFSSSLFFLYYGSEFFLRGEMLFPVALLLGTVKTLCQLNQKNELVALLAGGISLKILFRPFLFFALLFVAGLYLNAEYLQPWASKNLEEMENLHMGDKKFHMERGEGIYNYYLEDGSQIIFRKYDFELHHLLDLYWVRSHDTIEKIKRLDLSGSESQGVDVVHLRRNGNKELVVAGKSDTLPFPYLKFDTIALQSPFIAPENLSLSTLWRQLPLRGEAESEKEAKILAAFHRKLVFPWVCLLVVFVVAPACLTFSRQFSPFPIYAWSLFLLIFIYFCFDTAHIFAKRQLVNSALAFWGPFLAMLALSFLRYCQAVVWR